ncbi:MAG: cytochrome oxidase subunit III [Bacteroidia bacterium]|nr:MAG: cytochrome oxidase subunit III [Bacteroidia bacterium]
MDANFELKRRSLKNMLWLGIFSIIMVFSGLASAYIIRSKGGNWLHFQLPDIFYLSSVVIMISSVTIFLAQKNIQNNRIRPTVIFLLITFVLGIVFSLCQFLGWKELYANGIVYAGRYSNPSGSFLYLLTALHLLHLAGGMIGLMVTTIKTLLKKYTSENYLGIELIGIYWHFLDALWIFLFLFLILIR